MPKSAEVPPEEYLLAEHEERSMIEPRSYDNPRLKDLIAILIEWVNDELHGERIIVQDVEEDLYDGQVLQIYYYYFCYYYCCCYQVLQKLLEKVTGESLSVPEVTQSEEGQRNKLK